MPPARKPLALLELSGGLATNPGRYADRLNNPKPAEELGEAPDFLSEEEAAVWNKLKEIIPAGVLGNSDIFMVELAARYIVYSRKNWPLKPSEIAALTNIMGRLGLSPVDRTKIQVAPDKKDDAADPWTNF